MNRIDIIREMLSGISTESLADILRERGYEVRPAVEKTFPETKYRKVTMKGGQNETDLELDQVIFQQETGSRPYKASRIWVVGGRMATETFQIVPVSEIIDAMTGGKDEESR